MKITQHSQDPDGPDVTALRPLEISIREPGRPIAPGHGQTITRTGLIVYFSPIQLAIVPPVAPLEIWIMDDPDRPQPPSSIVFVTMSGDRIAIRPIPPGPTLEIVAMDPIDPGILPPFGATVIETLSGDRIAVRCEIYRIRPPARPELETRQEPNHER